MRKFLLRIVQNKVRLRVSKENQNSISEKLLEMRKFIPKEFARKPRSLSDILHWKATEFWQFLLYTGVIALKDEVNEEIFYEFLLLHSACRLLYSKKHRQSNLGVAQELL